MASTKDGRAGSVGEGDPGVPESGTTGWHRGLLSTAPAVTPSPVELAEVRLAVLGIGAPTASIPVGSDVKDAALDAGWLIVRDTEDAPVAAIRASSDTASGRVSGSVVPADGREHGPFAELRKPPVAVSLRAPLAFVGHDPLDDGALAQAHSTDAAVLFVVLDGPRTNPGPAGADTVRAVQATATELARTGRPTEVVVLPAPEYGDGRDAALQSTIAAAYGAVTAVPSHTLDRNALLAALDRPEPPSGLPMESVRAWRRYRPPRNRRGLAILFTGLSGSGKSTLARALVQALAEHSDRTVTLLDGDVVRRLLSSGLGFTRADRDLNVLRIGFVAAEIARHGGIAVCAPIAPFADTRQQVRDMVTKHGDFLLVHVATPLEECERRDRKGLYARARAGEIPEFTGISSPYEAPTDADLVLDTSELSIADGTRQALDLLRRGGWI